MQKHKLIIAVTGASGSIYAKRLFEKLGKAKDQITQVGIVFSDNAKAIWKFEIGDNSYKELPYSFFDRNDFNAPFASGSAKYNTMIVCPCSMGTMGRIANGISDDLITRAADVILKERRKLILVTRDTPLSLIHIENMKKISMAGGIICPANPSFYSKPTTINQLADTVIDRVLDLSGFEIQSNRWNEKD